MTRIHPNVTIRQISPNQSARANGTRIELIVLHDTESPEQGSNADLRAICDWFSNPSSQVSCHVVVDNNGQSAICVDSIRKAWHVANYNSVAVGIEQIGYSTDTGPVWAGRLSLLHETARWIARWSIMYHVPIQPAEVNDGAVIRPGVTMHRLLGALGGGHNDPGPGYPFESVLHLAVQYRQLLRAA